MSDADPAQLMPAPLSAPELPEVQWLWRRVFTYGLTVMLCALTALVIWSLAHPLGGDAVRAMERLGYGLLLLIALVTLFYLGGATLTDLLRLMAVAKDRISWRGATPGALS